MTCQDGRKLIVDMLSIQLEQENEILKELENFTALTSTAMELRNIHLVESLAKKKFLKNKIKQIELIIAK